MDMMVNKAIDTTYVSPYTHILGDYKLRTNWIPRLLGAKKYIVIINIW